MTLKPSVLNIVFTFLQEIVVHIFVNIVIGVPGLFSLDVHYSHHTMHP